ncbi:MAG: Asp/Glu/hydantoin racemase, partial [Lachnospiraceae bacterium]|nr:Asp/Glu/hydantoin racemase [Lachnospiraceae bacterium]
MRIGVIHATLNAVEPLVKAIHEVDFSAEVCNFVNEELL